MRACAAGRSGRLVASGGAFGCRAVAALGAGVRTGAAGRSGRLIASGGAVCRRTVAALRAGVRTGAAGRSGRLIASGGAFGRGAVAALRARMRTGATGRSGRLITGGAALRRRAVAPLGAGVRDGAASGACGLAGRGGPRRTGGRAVACLLVAAGLYLLVVAATAVALGPGVVLTVDVAIAIRVAFVRFALARIDGPVSVLIRTATCFRAGGSLRSAGGVAGAEGNHLFGRARLAQSRRIYSSNLRDCRGRARLAASLDNQW